MAERNALPGYQVVEPYRQGQLGNLCGIYAAINAARLLTPELAGDADPWTDAYNAAVGRLHARRRLKFGLTEGITYEVWKELQLTIYDDLSERLGCSFRMRPLARRTTEKSDFGAQVRGAIDRGEAVLWALCGPYNHYTVVAGYTSRRWLLHDSQAMKWIRTASTTIGARPEKHHWVPARAVFLLRRSVEGAEKYASHRDDQ